MKKINHAIKKVIILIALMLSLNVTASCDSYNNMVIDSVIETEGDFGQESFESHNSEANGFEWYLSKWDYNIPERDASIDDEKMYVKLPATYEETVDGMLFKVEFFNEIHTLDSYIQCRITLTNHTGHNIVSDEKFFFTPGGFVRNAEKYDQMPVYRSRNFYSIDQAVLCPFNLNNGDSYEIESIFIADKYFFEEGYDYLFVVELHATFELGEKRIYSISFPVELLQTE